MIYNFNFALTLYGLLPLLHLSMLCMILNGKDPKLCQLLVGHGNGQQWVADVPVEDIDPGILAEIEVASVHQAYFAGVRHTVFALAAVLVCAVAIFFMNEHMWYEHVLDVEEGWVGDD